MNDKLILENYLLVLKSTVEVYVHGTLESSNEDVKQLLKTSLNDILNMQRDTFNLMVSRNFYQVSNVNNSVISDTMNKLNNEKCS